MNYDGTNLEEVLEEHKKWLVSFFQEGSKANFSLADLRGAKLQGDVLQGADFREADLQGAKLHEAALQEADFRLADIRDADLQDADLQEADLREAALRGADLREVDFRGADLKDADLRRANLEFTDVKAFQICQYFAYSFNGRLKIGCLDYTLLYWAENVRTIGEKYNYNREEINKMEFLINSLIEGKL